MMISRKEFSGLVADHAAAYARYDWERKNLADFERKVRRATRRGDIKMPEGDHHDWFERARLFGARA